LHIYEIDLKERNAMPKDSMEYYLLFIVGEKKENV